MEFYSSIKFVMTVHNLQYQGVYSKQRLYDLLGIHDGYNIARHIEYYDVVNCFKGGLSLADAITTVSETYADEILLPYYAYGLEGVLNMKRGYITGIVNGIDNDLYNPMSDPNIYLNYDSNSFEYAKKANKEAMQKELGLEVSAAIPVIAMITRLVSQKGVDLVMRVFDEMISSTDAQFVLLGTGEPNYERFFTEKGKALNGRVSTNLLFNEGLARKIYAGSDLFLMPSLFEPCGLSQMIAMRYGSLPIVREVGGLRDTVPSCEAFPDTGTGYTFYDYNAHEMLYTIQRALKNYRKPVFHSSVVKRAMQMDFSWDVSAAKYEKLYDSLCVPQNGG
jgi:starch synthase